MLLLAAGRSQRFGGEKPKIWLDCAGRSLVHRSVARLAVVQEDREIILVVHPEDRATHLAPVLPLLREAGVDTVVDGGATRQESMRNAVAASDPKAPLILVHDAARPFPPVDAVRAAVESAARVGAACLAIPAPDTLKLVGADRMIVQTVDRSGIWQAQTPQVARRELLLRALEAARRDGFEGTDDMSLLERIGTRVAVVPGSRANLKVTTPEDLILARCLAQTEDAP
jgi:2-C-methyl-D-erythritol 4-phosphate cytidylyltransferase